MFDSSRPARHVVALLISVFVVGALGACAARQVGKPLIDRRHIEIDLVREVKGFTTQPRGYEHPAIISKQRMIHILNAVEVETREPGQGGVIRQPAFNPEIVERTAEAMVDAFAEADPNEELSVRSVRKERRLGIFHSKFLTSLLAYVDDGYLYLILNRIDWPIPQEDEEKPLPRPYRNQQVMSFRVVSGDPIYYAGPQALEIDWRNEVFKGDFRLPGSTSGEKRRREILEESPIPKDEQDAILADEESLAIDELSADQLRALADLEDDRREGRITENAYQRAKRELLRRR